MMNYSIKLNLGDVNISSLQSEDDLRREAKRLLPRVLVQVGESVGEKTWEAIRKGLKGPHFKPNTSATEKRKFIQEAGRNYQRSASSQDKRKLEDDIVEHLKQYMQAGK